MRPPPNAADLSELQRILLAFVAPGESQAGDARLNLPEPRNIKLSIRIVDGVEYTDLFFPSYTVTRSGYGCILAGTHTAKTMA